MAEEINIVINTDVKDATKDTENLGETLEKTGKKGTKGFAGISVQIKKMGTAIKASPLKIFVAILGALGVAFRKNQKVIDFFNIAMESLSIAFNDLFKFLEGNIGTVIGYFKDIFENPQEKLKEFGTAIKENLLERFESLLETFGHLGKSLGHLFKGEFAEAWNSVKDAGKESIDIITGVDNSVDKITETIIESSGAIKDYAKNIIETATATVELNKQIEFSKVAIAGVIAEYDRQAEKLRQVRDDETKTFEERIDANNQLADVLKEQGEEMQKLIDIQVAAAQAEYDKNQSQENLIRLTQALNEQKAVEAQITAKQSEQLKSNVALEKELADVKKQLSLVGLEGVDLELAQLEESYKQKLEMARKAGVDTAAIEQEFADKKADIARELTNSQLSAAADLAGALSSLAGDSKELAVAQAIIDTYVGANKAFAIAGPAGFISGAAIIVQGLANVKKIMEQDVGTGSGGGATSPSAFQSRFLASDSQLASGAFTLGGGLEPEPARAFVVSDDITNSQNKLANIRRRATI